MLRQYAQCARCGRLYEVRALNGVAREEVCEECKARAKEASGRAE